MTNPSPESEGFVFSLCVYEGNLPPVLLRPYGEVDPEAALLVAFDQEFVEVALGAVGDVEEGVGIAEGLLNALASDVHGATCEVIAGW